MTPKEYKQMMDYLTRSGIKDQIKFASEIAIPDPKPAVREIELFNRFNKDYPNYADGGMLVKPSVDGRRPGYAKVKDAIGRTYDSDNMGRKPKLEGKVGRIVEYLQDLPDGASFYKPDVAKLLNLGVGVKRGKEYADTSLLTKAINSRKELKNKKFKFLTKTDVTVNKINDFVEIFVQENGRAPTQGEIQKGAKADPTRIRTYIEEGKVKNVADTVFDTQAKGANYILNTKKPTIEGLEKIVGKGKAEKLLARIYINSLGSLKKKFSNIDEGRSVYANFDKDQIQLIKNKVRRVPGFTEVYGREITDLIANAYPNPKDAAKKTAALKKVSMFKRFNKEVSKKFGLNQVLDHPLSYDFITKTSQGVDPSELIRVRPLPDRENTFKSFLESDLEDISKTLKKGYDQKAFSKYKDMKSIADELGIPFPKMAKTGTITSPAASKVGTKPLIGDVKQAAKIRNNFRSFVQNVKDDPRMQRLGINLKELTDLAKLPEIDIAKYDNAVKKFISKSGKFGIPLMAGYAGVRGTDFLKKEGIGFDKEFEQTAAVGDAPIVEKGLSTGEKAAAGTTAALTLGTKKGRNILGRIIGGAFGPTGLAGLTVADGGYDLSSPLDRLILGTEAAFAPELVKGTIGATKGMKNRALQKVVQRALNLGMSVPTALKAARIASPLGLASLAGEGIYQVGKLGFEDQKRFDALTPEQQAAERAEQEAFAFDVEGAKDGGRMGFKVGTVKKTVSSLDELIKKTLDEDLFDKKDRMIDQLNLSLQKVRKKFAPKEKKFEEPHNLQQYLDITESNFKTKTGPFFDRLRAREKRIAEEKIPLSLDEIMRDQKAGGGLLKQAGDRSGAMLESMNPDSQGLPGLLKRGMKI